MFLLLLFLALLGWLALAGVVYGFVRTRHDFPTASYLNIVWPPNWPKHRLALGAHYLEKAKLAMQAQDYGEAAMLYATGLARVPQNSEARRELAILYLRFGQPQASLNLLVAGLGFSTSDLEYLKLTFKLLDESREDSRVIELVEKYLPPQPDALIAHQFLALQKATAHFHRGNYDGAEKTVNEWQLDRSLEGQLLLARCDWERGYPDLALVRLDRQRSSFPQRDEIPLLLIRYYRELGRQEDALNESLIRHIADPASPGPRVDLMYAWRQKNDATRYHRELESYLNDFAKDQNAILLLAWFAADSADLDLAKRLRELATANAFQPYAFDLVLVQTMIARGDYRAALTASEAALATPAGKDPRFASVLSGLRALAAFGVGDPSNGGVYLQAFLIRDYLRASDALLLSERLEEIGAHPQARQVLVTAVTNDAGNQAALTALIKLETATGNLAALESYLPRLLAMRKPSRNVLQEAYLKIDESTPTRVQLRESIKAALSKSPVLREPGT